MRSGLALLAGTTTLLLATADAGAVTMDYLSTWSASRAYAAGAVVVYGNEVYYAVSASRNSIPAPTNRLWQIIGRTGMDYEGAWDRTTVYQIGSVVTHNGQTYHSLRLGNLNRMPSPSSTDWAIIGTVGNTIKSGAGAPTAIIGAPGDFWIDTANSLLYGPRTATGWPSFGTPLKGPAGADGPTGPAGPQGAAGATGAVGTVGARGATGATGPAGAAGARGATGSNASITVQMSSPSALSTIDQASWLVPTEDQSLWTIITTTATLPAGRYMITGTAHANLPSGTSVTCTMRDEANNVIGEKATAYNGATGVTVDKRQFTLMGEQRLSQAMTVTIACNAPPSGSNPRPKIGLGSIMAVKLE